MLNDKINTIDFDDWELCSTRDNSQNYLSRDKNWLLKFSSRDNANTLDAMIKEKEVSDNAISLGIITPFVREIVKAKDGRYGIIYENIKGKKSISRAISEDFGKADLYMKKFADMGKRIHNTICDKNRYMSIEDKIDLELDKHNIYSSEEKKLMHKLMDKIEKKDTFLHVDFHLGNILTTDNGEYVIDISLKHIRH